jgi:hypothetical protein
VGQGEIMEIVNMLGTKINPIDWLIPGGKSWFKISTTQKMQRFVWAIVLFFGFLALLMVAGIFKTVQISLTVAYREFESALQDSEPMEILNSQKMDEIEGTLPIVPVRDMRIRSLRKEASQQGIRNVSRMTKAELLVVLQIPIETKQ